MVEFLTGMKRTAMCGELRADSIGKEVVIMGWVNRRRDLGSLIFVQLRDRSGIVQAVFDSETTDKQLFEKASSIKMEYVIAVRGKVRRRVGDNVNPNMETGEIEVVADELRILSESDTLPFVVGDITAGELLRLKYRYLDLRRADLQHNLMIRSKAAYSIREYLTQEGFLEIETPFLGKSTPEGARDYLVPSRVHPNKYYALPQSPQLYKQLLMIGGMDRYYQIVKCFRDEDLRANRQPEFTQIDLEMSFVDSEEDVMNIAEGLIIKLFRDIRNIELPAPFRRMTYAEAMAGYGSDKPDLRFDMKIKDVSEAVRESGFTVFENAVQAGGSVQAIKLEGKEKSLSRKDFDKLNEFIKAYGVKGVAWLAEGSDQTVRSSFASKMNRESLDKLRELTGLQEGDVLFVVADADTEKAQTAVGALRCELAERFGLIKDDGFAVTWIVDFPLFEYSEEEGRLVAKHHPFTSPKNEDLPLMKTDPAAVRAKAYDLVINGEEVGGGSLRIYSREVQELMFETLGFTEEQIKDKFGYFVDAFKYGTPPHGGLAFGFDRLIMQLCGAQSIRDVIAFPKIQNASCVMSQAPSEVEEKQLRELSIKYFDYENK